MRGEWNGLQALFLNDCPYAYYVHCFVHWLQLALVVASREVIPIHNFFSDLAFIANIVGPLVNVMMSYKLLKQRKLQTCWQLMNLKLVNDLTRLAL